jgi:thiamine pyrophosphate-dependent acetolactate synthase large subunit-like protein
MTGIWNDQMEHWIWVLMMFGLDYNNPDFVKYADSYGAKGHRPKNDAEFQKILIIV